MLFRSNTSFQNIGWQLYLVSKKKGGGGDHINFKSICVI
ncbi:hypothetical protein EE612_047549 [Oryza sativa]|nr:hypothetical protein EE612_047549 [Oryza sativa]